MIKPMSHQKDALNSIMEALQSGFDRVIFTLETGGGKTIIAGMIAKVLEEAKAPLLILVHRNSLAEQMSNALNLMGIKHGFVKAGQPTPIELIKVGMVQTVSRRNLDKQALIIIDEAHHCANENMWMRVSRLGDRVVGLTATPVRSDGAGLGEKSGGIFQKLINGVGFEELKRIGRLVPLRIFAPPPVIDWKKFVVKGSDFDSESINSEMDKKKIYGSAVVVWRKLADGLRTIIFCHSVKVAKAVEEEFNSCCIKSLTVTGEDSAGEQRAKIKALADKSILVLVSVDVISEGTDVPLAECAVMMRPTMSFGLFRQMAGRVMRWADGKECGILIDMVGNVAMHGAPGDDIAWELDSSESLNVKKSDIDKGIVKLKQCENCWQYRKLNPCEHCGHVTDGSREIKQITFEEYVEIEQKKALDIKKRIEGKEVLMLKKFMEMAKKNGYKKFWALKRFEYSFGRMPTKKELDECTK